MSDKAVVNLFTGVEENAERVTTAFLVAGAALDAGKQTIFFLTQEAVRLAQPGVAVGVGCEGCPPLETLFQQFAEKGGELLACPFCINARGLQDAELVPNARVAGSTPLWEWIGEGATVFSF